MDRKRAKGVDTKQVGKWLLVEANKSFRYWHSSMSCRYGMKNPFFDKNQCKKILELYTGDDEDNKIA